MTSAPPGRYRTRTPLPGWAKAVIAVLLVLVVAALAAVGLFVWAFSGGWDGIRRQAQPDDRRVERARAASTGELDALTAAVLAAVGAGTPTARVRADLCLRGQNNWKVHEGYTLRCERRDGVVLDAGPDLAAVARRTDAALVAAGWQAAAGGGLTFPGEGALPPLRTARYERPGHPDRSLELALADRAGPTVGAELRYLPDDARTEGDLAAFTRAAESSGPRVVVLTTVRYFED